jgi:tripartite-type tricarboxylate transporter receptor subunit TctC
MWIWRTTNGVLAATVLAGSGAVSAQEYPAKPIRIVTSSPGGGSDFVARAIATGISGPLGQPVVVDNRTSGVIPIEVVSKAPSDGYTLLVSGGVLWISPLLRKVPYEVATDFVPISLVTREIFVFAIHPSLPAKSVKELIALARARPGELNYGAGDVGGTNYLTIELFKSLAGINLVHVPYKAPAQVMTSLIAGEVQVAAYDASLTLPHAKTGRLRALAITSAEPSPLAPGIPTVAATVPGYEMVGRTGLLAPGKTPAAIVNRLNQEVSRLLNSPEVKERFLNAGVDVVGGTPDQFGAAIRADMTRLGKVIKDAGLKVN